MDFQAFSAFLVTSAYNLWQFMLSNLLTGSILVVLILFPKLFQLFRRFVAGR